jgi:nicotinate-nucleotide--dimethylbenzimidazole phosphoribosyltransferase
MLVDQIFAIAIPALDKAAGLFAAKHIDNLTKPPGSLGRLEQLAIQLAEICASPFPTVKPPAIIVFAADHGIADAGISAYPKEVTMQMAQNFLQGGAAVNVFSKQINGTFHLVDVGISKKIDAENLISHRIGAGTKNFLHGDAMTREEALQAIKTGYEVALACINDGAHCIIPGEMGIGNTTASTAILAVLSEYPVAQLVGAGTGLTPDRVTYKQQVIEEALRNRQPNKHDPIEVLSKVGGFEIGALAGAMIAAAERRIPVLLDGFICTAAAVLAHTIHPQVKDYVIAGHQSVEPGHQVALQILGLEPLLSLRLRLGEGSGAALAFPLLEAAVNMMTQMATFQSAGVSTKKQL